MRIRTGLTPDAWRDDGPATPGRRIHGYVSVPVTVVGSMRPVMTAGVTFETNRLHRPKVALSITGKPKP
jgi:hypothetical protein